MLVFIRDRGGNQNPPPCFSPGPNRIDPVFSSVFDSSKPGPMAPFHGGCYLLVCIVLTLVGNFPQQECPLIPPFQVERWVTTVCPEKSFYWRVFSGGHFRAFILCFSVCCFHYLLLLFFLYLVMFFSKTMGIFLLFVMGFNIFPFPVPPFFFKLGQSDLNQLPFQPLLPF